MANQYCNKALCGSLGMKYTDKKKKSTAKKKSNKKGGKKK